MVQVTFDSLVFLKTTYYLSTNFLLYGQFNVYCHLDTEIKDLPVTNHFFTLKTFFKRYRYVIFFCGLDFSYAYLFCKVCSHTFPLTNLIIFQSFVQYLETLHAATFELWSKLICNVFSVCLLLRIRYFTGIVGLATFHHTL